ncbi:hypothetical protein HY477_01910 [Candidatus Uhrbacteria bacterium]|nr:hypothetical protein [Candidatus Uhrbacteria bacterium]
MREERRVLERWWLWALGLIVISLIVLSVLGYAGVFTRTVVERKVFESSFQYSEARKTEIATYEAQLAELEHKLTNPDLDATTRTNIEAQMSAIRIQLNTARGRQ